MQNIVLWHERMGKSADEIATEYDLSLADVHAALVFYFVNRSAIDAVIDSDRDLVESMKKQTPSKRAQKLWGRQRVDRLIRFPRDAKRKFLPLRTSESRGHSQSWSR